MKQRIVGSRLLHNHYVPWLAKCDATIGRLARNDLAKGYSFLAAFQLGLSPVEAVEAAFQSHYESVPNTRDFELLHAWLRPDNGARQ